MSKNTIPIRIRKKDYELLKRRMPDYNNSVRLNLLINSSLFKLEDILNTPVKRKRRR